MSTARPWVIRYIGKTVYDDGPVYFRGRRPRRWTDKPHLALHFETRNETSEKIKLLMLWPDAAEPRRVKPKKRSATAPRPEPPAATWTTLAALRPGAVFETRDGDRLVCGFGGDGLRCLRLDNCNTCTLAANTEVRELAVGGARAEAAPSAAVRANTAALVEAVEYAAFAGLFECRRRPTCDERLHECGTVTWCHRCAIADAIDRTKREAAAVLTEAARSGEETGR